MSATEQNNHNHLPVEIAALIINHMCQQDIAPLALVSKTFYRAASSRLYRRVFFLEPEPSSRLFVGIGLPESEDYLTPKVDYNLFARASRIYSPSLFLRSILESNELRCSVVAASFRYAYYPAHKGVDRGEQDIIDQIVDLLSRSASYIHVVSSAGLPVPCMRNHGVSSTFIDTRTLRHEGFDESGRLSIFDRQKWSELFNVESLKCLELSHVRRWEEATESSESTEPLEARSNVESLVISNSSAPGETLEEVLSWPKALKYFHFSANRTNPSEWIASAKIFAQALSSQKFSLVSITIRAWPVHPGYYLNTAHGFQDFDQLRDLAVPPEFIISGQGQGLIQYDERDVEQLASSLPQSLKRLQFNLIFSAQFTWELYPPPYTQQMPETFNDFLCGISELKNRYVPELREIIVWRYKSYGVFETALHLVSEFSGMLSKMREAGIRLRAIDCRDLPILMDL